MMKKLSVIVIITVIVVILTACVLIVKPSVIDSLINNTSKDPSPGATAGITPGTTSEITPPPQTNILESALDVIFLDVDQADCILLKTDYHTMLIDAGNTGQDKLILNYLAEYNITTLDYLVATHPHAD
ncbi:MAG: MBL fold metallo-hydrolase, partial [Nitrososphaerota archaeon]|nr:MBL fold metallo-hydrolase [Nitrososphaerota archaeon]